GRLEVRLPLPGRRRPALPDLHAAQARSAARVVPPRRPETQRRAEEGAGRGREGRRREAREDARRRPEEGPERAAELLPSWRLPQGRPDPCRRRGREDEAVGQTEEGAGGVAEGRRRQARQDPEGRPEEAVQGHARREDASDRWWGLWRRRL